MKTVVASLESKTQTPLSQWNPERFTARLTSTGPLRCDFRHSLDSCLHYDNNGDICIGPTWDQKQRLMLPERKAADDDLRKELCVTEDDYIFIPGLNLRRSMMNAMRCILSGPDVHTFFKGVAVDQITTNIKVDECGFERFSARAYGLRGKLYTLAIPILKHWSGDLRFSIAGSAGEWQGADDLNMLENLIARAGSLFGAGRSAGGAGYITDGLFEVESVRLLN